MPNLMWFRRDLRMRDNPALFEACESSYNGVIALFIITPETWKFHSISPLQIVFLLENLKILSKELKKKNIPLLIREASLFKDIPELMLKLVHEYNIESLFYNRQYEWDERQRDAAVTKTLQDICKIYTFDDQVIIPPEKILNQQQEPFKVFTPFKRKWLSLAENYLTQPLPMPASQFKLPFKSDAISTLLNELTITTKNIPFPPAGESAAIQKLTLFSAKNILHYQTTRDFPQMDATSHLSPYLALGILSPRQCISRVMAEQPLPFFADLFNKSGPAVWISELIWREFYKMIMFHFPQVCKYKAFKALTEKLPWRYDKKVFAKWCEGSTGFPLVDAAMRQLNQTGWMHNRLRMVTAMFLSKILFIDWRWGERYFSEHLIDIDFSANNGGWQWSASTGTDAVPYFRIFNPITQSEKYDSKGDFIRQFCPELSHLDSKVIHDPFAHGIKLTALHYPEKIVDYKKMRQCTLDAFKYLSSPNSL
jgi:deoxyribodipyrimidine photo-lyase